MHAQIVASIEEQVSGVTRVLRTPPPESSDCLRMFFDVLYCLDDPRHQRKHGTKSVLIQDIEVLLRWRTAIQCPIA